jgi:FixJ family two-component response regulator
MIAIVDDDELMRTALLGLMKEAGLAARAFPSAEAFFQSDERHQASCVVTDLRMQSMSGLDLQEKLLAEQNKAFVIFIAAHGDERTRILASEGGAVGFLTKPFDGELLVHMVRTASQLQQRL